MSGDFIKTDIRLKKEQKQHKAKSLENTCFNPQKHICRFVFQQTGIMHSNYYHQTITGNLSTNELVIELKTDRGVTAEVYGYRLDNYISTILPMLVWDDFERYRYISNVDLQNHIGYRDGWGYKFLCMCENGKPMISNYLNFCFDKYSQPPYERLLSWIKDVYSTKKEFKDKKILW